MQRFSKRVHLQKEIENQLNLFESNHIWTDGSKQRFSSCEPSSLTNFQLHPIYMRKLPELIQCYMKMHLIQFDARFFSHSNLLQVTGEVNKKRSEKITSCSQ